MEKKYIVYTITLQGEVKYVGKTNDLCARKSAHKTKRGTHNSAIPLEVDLSLIQFNIVAEFTDEVEALKLEDKLIDRYDTINNGWNNRRSGLIKAENPNEYKRIWAQSHKESVTAARKRYEKTEKGKEVRKQSCIRYRANHPEYFKEYEKQRYQKRTENKRR